MLDPNQRRPAPLAPVENDAGATAGSIGVIILNYNTLADTRECLAKLLSGDATNRRILVLDNGSQRDEAGRLAGDFDDQVLIVPSPVNLGFARGCNVGANILLRRAKPRSLLFLNSDAMISWDDVRRLDGFVHSFQGIAAAGPSILFPSGRPQSAGGKIDYMRGNPSWFEALRSNAPYEVEVLHGAALLVRTEAWTKIGPFDPDYFSYSEETDWCARATKAGWKLFCVPECVAYHKVRGSTGGDLTPMHVYLWARNRIVFMGKQAAPGKYAAFWAYMTWYIARNFLRFQRDRDRTRLEALLRGVRDGLQQWLSTSRPSIQEQQLDWIERDILTEFG